VFSDVEVLTWTHIWCDKTTIAAAPVLPAAAPSFKNLMEPKAGKFIGRAFTDVHQSH
jgi:hypothetical protein